jgi:tryptophan synthase alpha chain
MSRIAPTFERLRQQGRQALIMYLTVGFPRRDSALELVPAIVAAGADIVELGVPFSDPLADGATVQRATQRALQNGVDLRYCLQTVRDLRAGGLQAPILFMGYLNPMLQYGILRFCQDAAAAGVDGLIVPDLPADEADELQAACRQNDIDLIFLLAPTSTDDRIQAAAQLASGFVYCVSLTGITGARRELPPELPAFLQRVRQATDLPLAVGFGISEPRHARQVAELADGVIIGSALLNLVESAATEGSQAVQTFVSSMRGGVDAARRTGAAVDSPQG